MAASLGTSEHRRALVEPGLAHAETSLVLRPAYTPAYEVKRQLLALPALDAICQWRYEPTVLYGKPVPVLLWVRVEFVLTLARE